MLGFIVTLKSRQVSDDWALVGRLLERTLRSACAQTHPDFRAAVICHEVPNLHFAHPQVEFHSVDFDSPGPERAARFDDKNRKQYEGLQRIRMRNPSHIMVLDFDDLVSNRLGALVAAHPTANGWYSRSGYFHAPGMSTVHLERRRFDQWCGSSIILRPENVELDPSEGSWRLGHRTVATRQAARGTPLRPLPFRGGVYNVSHGENFNDYAPILWPTNPVRRLARRLLFLRRITPQIRDEFGLYPVEVSTHG